MFRFLILLVLLNFSSYCFAQLGSKPMFNLEILSSPIVNSQWFDNNLEVVYLDRYDTSFIQNTFLFKNGYALHELSDKDLFSRIISSVNPISIDIVFTHYPVKKEDWITNYYELLANRLKELFLVAPWLNSTSFNWRLVKQTRGLNSSETERLFHGIAIGFEPVQYARINPLNPSGLMVRFENQLATILKRESEINIQKTKEEDYSSIVAILYPESIYNRKVEQYIPPRPPRPNDPSCPTFVSRMQKPKRSFLGRLFRR